MAPDASHYRKDPSMAIEPGHFARHGGPIQPGRSPMLGQISMAAALGLAGATLVPVTSAALSLPFS
jgi:hypothetical protein